MSQGWGATWNEFEQGKNYESRIDFKGCMSSFKVDKTTFLFVHC